MRLYVLLALLFGLTTNAQAASLELKGITTASFQVLMSEPSSTECGLDNASVTNELKFPIQAYTAIEEDNSRIGTQIVLRLESLPVRVGGEYIGCAHSVRIEVFWIGSARLVGAQIADGVHEILLWSEGITALSPAEENVSHVKRMIKDIGRRLASAWQEANR